MKIRNISIIVLAFILLILFLPVFYCILFYGSNMNYFEAYKLVTIEGNKVLFLVALFGVALFSLLYLWLRKLPYNKSTVTGVVIASFVVCFLLYIANENISKCIAFYSGWDCGMVANSARWIFEGGELGYGDYYTIFSNNVPITWLLYKLYCFSNHLPNYPYNPEFIWIQFQCVMFSTAVFFSVMTVLLSCRKIGTAIMTLLINSLFLLLSPWQIIPYTDGSTIAIPVMLLFFYTCFRCCKTNRRYAIWFLIVLTGMLGGMMKATCYVTFIAIVLVDILWFVTEKEPFRQKVKKSVLQIALLFCGFLIAVLCRQGMYQTLNYEYDQNMGISWRSFLYDGLNEENTGTCSEDGMLIAREYAGKPKEERIAYETECMKQRIQEKGFGGLLSFWLRKQVMSYNDGTFTWFQEGFFNAWEYENITDSNWKEPLRAFYWNDGRYFKVFTTLSQVFWLFLLLGVIVEASIVLLYSINNLKKQKDDTGWNGNKTSIRVVEILTFIGVFLFVMLFEGRARYLFNSVIVFTTMAVEGYSELINHDFCLIRGTSILQIPE